MAAKKTSVALLPEDITRYRDAADARGISLSTFLKRCADTALATPDPRADLRAFAADLRADLRGEFAKVSEVVALGAARTDEMQRLFHVFLHDLNKQQIEAVQLAHMVGRGKEETETTKKSVPDYRNPPTY